MFIFIHSHIIQSPTNFHRVWTACERRSAHYFLPFFCFLLLQCMYFSLCYQINSAKGLSPFINGLFFSNLSYQVAKKIENRSKHMHQKGPYFPQSKEAAHCGRFGTLGTNTYSKMARGRHGCFSPVFHLLCEVSSDYR